MEGHSVTLHTDLTHIKTHDVIEWRFKDFRIARIKRSVNINHIYDETIEIFRDRLKMNNQTGDLTITHITSQHSGLYKLYILGRNKDTVKRFHLTVNDADIHPIDQHDEEAVDVHHTEGKTHLVYIVVISCAVGTVMIVASLLMFFICRKHTNTRQQQQQDYEKQIICSDSTFTKHNTQESEMMTVVYTYYSFKGDQTTLSPVMD
ncbi:uncharacterized protein LOC130430449 [Triplophysa dalaica]|uniref:uncharacterized protein LOC130430449 n=1 Tax=Triplophysa dalaica TaxID=1582913 RepID=UPI0024DF3212|nr:uncharacterized protein LOC130430449 [Triplophysa dalaica]